jgi:hypothetical protein
VIGWLVGLSLRVKVYAAMAAALVLSFGGLWVAWRLSKAKAERAGARADALERARAAELRISERISKLRGREREWRDELSKRKTRDHFEQGWGP